MKVDLSKAKAVGGRFDFPNLKLKKDEVARVNLFSTKLIEVTVRHWVPKLGYVHCLALPQMESLEEMVACEEEGGRPDDCYICKLALENPDDIGAPTCRFAARILRYKTDLTGRALGTEISYWMEIWVFDSYKFRNLKKQQDEWGSLANHDLEITCENEKFQNVTINVQKQALWKKEDRTKFKEYLEAEAKKYNLMKCLGREIDEEAIKKRFALQERRTQEETPVELEEDVLTSESEEQEEIFEAEAKEKGGELPKVEEVEESETDFLDNVLKE